jgi:oxygen-independent coproporphyrinogen III oxidase
VKASSRWDAPSFNAEIILKYDKPGPRYTSYPTAPYFHEGFNNRSYLEEIDEINKAAVATPVSLYFHLPFCQSVCWFCGCNVHYTKDKSLSERYVETMLRELSKLKTLLRRDRKVVQIHWGGGTPTFIPAGLLKKLSDGIFSAFELGDSPEMGIELDPRALTEEHFAFLEQSRFNRFSMGIQDFDPKVQMAIHRTQSEELTFGAFNRLRKMGFNSINVDLIYGLPYQTAESFRYTVRRVVDLSPDRIAVFNFAFLPELLPHQRAIRSEALPEPSEKLKILEMVVETLTSSGYVYIGMDHFAKPDDELTLALKNRTLYRNFQGYTTKSGCDLHGIGATSISQIGRIYAQNIKRVDAYIRSVDDNGLSVFRGLRLSDDDLLRRDIISRLMCHFVLFKKEIEEQYAIVFDDFFSDALNELEPMQADGLLELFSDKIDVKPLGRLLIRNIAMAFDGYLKREGETKRFSRTI